MAVTELDLCADSFLMLVDRSIQRGTAVLPVGHPNGVRWFLPVTSDTVTRLDRGEVNFQSSLLAPGHSGGPLMSSSGHWVGLLTADAPPFGRAASAESVLRRLIDWRVPTLMHNLGHLALLRSIETGNTTTLREQLRICDGNQWGAEVAQYSFVNLPLVQAVKSRNLAVVQELLRAGVRPDAEINFSETLLHRAAREGLSDIVAALLAAGAKPDLRNHEGTTPLMEAAALGRTETVRALLAAGADPDLKDRRGQSARAQARSPEVTVLMDARPAAAR